VLAVIFSNLSAAKQNEALSLIFLALELLNLPIQLVPFSAPISLLLIFN